MMFPTQYVANWNHMQERKRMKMRKDNQRENERRHVHDYSVGDLILVRREKKHGEILPKLARPTLGPFRVLKVFDNGTVMIQRHGFRERINVRRLIPFQH
jgi:hypothetical protein